MFVSHRHPMRRLPGRFLSALACIIAVLAVSGSPKKEFLTEKEIEQIQDNNEIHIRVKLYLD